MARIPRPGPGQSSALEPPAEPHDIVVEGVPIDFNGDGVPRIRDIDLAVKLGYARPRKIRDLIARLIKEGQISDVERRPVVGRRGFAEEIVDEYWLTEEQAYFVAARSSTPIATQMLKDLIRVFVLARQGRLQALPAEPAPAELPPKAREPPPDPPELAAAVELLGAVDPRVVAAVRKLPAPKHPSVGHFVEQARELAQLVERTEPPLPADTFACARLASALIRATTAAPDHPLVLGTRGDLARTLATIDRLLARAALDPDLRDRVADLRARWTAVLEHLPR